MSTGFLFAAPALALLLVSQVGSVLAFFLLGLIYVVPPVRAFASAALNAAFLARTGTTPGKWLCGIRLTRRDGARVDFRQAFMRELDALAVGCALYIPLAASIAMGAHFFKLRREGATSWDEQRDLVVVQRPDSRRQGVLTGSAFLAMVVFLILDLGAAVFASFALQGRAG